MGSVRVRVKDNGFLRRMAAIRRAATGGGVAVGVHAQEGAEEKKVGEGEAAPAEPITVLDVAVWNEFGLGVPERSFLRAWFDGATDENRAAMTKALTLALRGTRTFEQAMSLVGLRFVGKIQQRISTHIAPENAEATIEKKGSSTPLIDTGQLRQSLTYKVTSGAKPGSD